MPAGGVITLAIETSNPGGGAGSAGICLGHQDQDGSTRLIAARTLEPASRHDDALMPAIDAMCREQRIEPRDLGRVAVSIGPGGYTTIRIAVTTAKMIALATGAAAIPVPTASAVALRAGSQPSRRLIIALAWKRETVWRQVFIPRPSTRPEPQGEGEVISLKALAEESGGATVVADPELVALLAPMLPPDARTETPRFEASAVFEASLGVSPVDPGRLLPLYPREPEAVTNWRILKSR